MRRRPGDYPSDGSDALIACPTSCYPPLPEVRNSTPRRTHRQASRLLPGLALLVSCAPSCGKGEDWPPVSVSDHWRQSRTPCKPPPELELVVTTEEGATVQALGRSQKAANWLGHSTARFQIPREELGAAPRTLQISVEHEGYRRQVSHAVSPEPARLEIRWTGLSEGFVQPALAALVKRRWSFGPNSPMEEDSARHQAVFQLRENQLVWRLEACHVASAEAALGEVEATPDEVVWKLPLSFFLTHRLAVPPEIQQAHVETPVLRLKGVGEETAELTPRFSSDDLVEVLFSGLPERPLPDAEAYQRGGPILLLEYRPEATHFGRPRLLSDSGAALADIAAVAVARRREVTVETCQYDFPFKETVRRVREEVSVKVYETRSGRLIASRELAGSAPAPCPPKITVRIYQSRTEKPTLLGSSPDVAGWLKQM